MRVFKKLNAALALALTLAFVSPIVTPVTNVAVTEAASVKLSKTKKNLKVGKSFKLKVKRTSEKATFTSSDESIAKVDKKGKVTAVAPGKATITANVAGNKLTCKVTVKASVNPAVTNAPFEAKEVVVNGYKFVVPANWISQEASQDGISAWVATPTNKTTSAVQIIVEEAEGIGVLGYNAFKEIVAAKYSEENIMAMAEDGIISNYTTADVETPLGTAFYLYYDATAETEDISLDMSEADYILAVDDVLIVIQGINLPVDDVKEPSIQEIIDYIVQNIIG